MASIVFYTGTMMSGKTTHLLQNHYNLENAFPGEVLLINKNDRSGDSVCTNRMGGVSLSTGLTDTSSIFDIVTEHEEKTRQQIKHILVDEVQFFTTTQIEELAYLADIRHTSIYAYGLLTSYKGKLFPATQRLIELADKIVQLENGMRCWCGKRATHNALYLYEKAVSTSPDDLVDNNKSIHYQVMCRKHFLEHINNTKLSSQLGRKRTSVTID